MYLFLGGNTTVENNEIIGIFDMDNTTVSERARKFLTAAQKNGLIKETSNELPKSFVVCDDKVYLSQFNTSTLKKRIENNTDFHFYEYY